MEYLSVKEIADKWGLSERSVRNYCAQGRIEGAILKGKIWQIPQDAQKPSRKTRTPKVKNDLLSRLRYEKQQGLSFGIYHNLQINFTYNSNHIEGSRLSFDQTRYIFETNTIGVKNQSADVDDVIEAKNHFRCIDFVIDNSHRQLTEKMIKELHRILKAGTSDSDKAWFAVGDYKQLPNIVGGVATTSPENVHAEVQKLLLDYNKSSSASFEDIVAFHCKFEKIHPFQDGNGRVGRLIMLKECLKNGLVPFIIDDDIKAFYYRGLQNWPREKGYMIDTCLHAQDKFKEQLKFFEIDF